MWDYIFSNQYGAMWDLPLQRFTSLFSFMKEAHYGQMTWHWSKESYDRWPNWAIDRNAVVFLSKMAGSDTLFTQSCSLSHGESYCDQWISLCRKAGAHLILAFLKARLLASLCNQWKEMDTLREWFSYSWDRLKCQMWSARIWSRGAFIHSAILSTEGSNLHQQAWYMQSDYPVVQADTNWCQREFITGISMTLCLNKYTCPSIYLRSHKNRNWFNMAWGKLFSRVCPACSSAGDTHTENFRETAGSQDCQVQCFVLLCNRWRQSGYFRG